MNQDQEYQTIKASTLALLMHGEQMLRPMSLDEIGKMLEQAAQSPAVNAAVLRILLSLVGGELRRRDGSC